jgi:hypothetical protein
MPAVTDSVQDISGTVRVCAGHGPPLQQPPPPHTHTMSTHLPVLYTSLQGTPLARACCHTSCSLAVWASAAGSGPTKVSSRSDTNIRRLLICQLVKDVVEDVHWAVDTAAAVPGATAADRPGLREGALAGCVGVEAALLPQGMAAAEGRAPCAAASGLMGSCMASCAARRLGTCGGKNKKQLLSCCVCHDRWHASSSMHAGVACTRAAATSPAR